MTAKQKQQQHITLTSAYLDYKKALKAYAFYKVSDHAISEDLVQDTFVKTWNYIKKGGQVNTMKAFLYHILNNLIVDQYRKHKNVSLDVLLEKGYEPTTGGSDSEHLLNVLDGKEAFHLIERLPKNYKKIIHMKYMQDLSLKEMSSITGYSKNTIAVQAHRGMEKLKQLYNLHNSQFFVSSAGIEPAITP